jgi:hypothetical protein
VPFGDGVAAVERLDLPRLAAGNNLPAGPRGIR